MCTGLNLLGEQIDMRNLLNSGENGPLDKEE